MNVESRERLLLFLCIVFLLLLSHKLVYSIIFARVIYADRTKSKLLAIYLYVTLISRDLRRIEHYALDQDYISVATAMRRSLKENRVSSQYQGCFVIKIRTMVNLALQSISMY